MEINRKTFFGLHFDVRKEEVGSHTVPAECLIQALDGLQRTVHLVAMMQSRKEIKTRARVTREIEDNYQLHCNVPKEGSYFQGAFVAARQEILFEPLEIETVAETTRQLLSSIGHADNEEFKNVVPDSAYRLPLLGSIEKIFSKRSGNVGLIVEDAHGIALLDDEKAGISIDRLREYGKEPTETATIVTGYLTRVDFRERKLFLQLPTTNRTISCNYNEIVEPILLESPRDLIQVVGTIELDDNGDPERITDVDEVHPVDTNDVDILDLLGKDLKPNKLNNLWIKVNLSDDKQTYSAEYFDLDIFVTAYTREDLLDSLEAEIDFLWRNIAKSDDTDLTPKAKTLKKTLLGLFKEIAT